MSYSRWKKILRDFKNNLNRDAFEVLTFFFYDLVEDQVNTIEVQKILNDKTLKFDLVLVEANVDVALGLAYLYKAPVIQFSSLGVGTNTYKTFGTPVNPILYPTPFHEKLYNLTAWEKISETYHDYKFERIATDNKEYFESLLKRLYGPDVPSLEELRSNVDMLFLNVHAVWDFNRPVPPNVIYLGGFHQKPEQDLPKDLQNYFDSSKNGVIYVSFGTNVDPDLFPPEIINIFVNVFSELPYDVLWKWNQDELPGRTDNIKISKWLPQSDLLRHPKVKLFITQGGLQSTDEAITAGVPLIGIPILGDQKFNVEQYIHFRIGERVEIESITEENLSTAINKILQDESYRKNVEKLRLIMNDQPQSPLERAVWWTEYVIRHKGVKHLRPPAASMSVVEYYQLELITYIILSLFGVVTVILCSLYFLFFWIFGASKKLKKN
nr:uridine diphosphate-glycosyltransferases 33AP3 [Glyphodes pyloalis]